jgi:MFS family permease
VGGVISGLLGFRNVFGLSGVVVLLGSAVGLLYFPRSSEARPKATRPSISKGFNALRRSTIVLMSWVSIFTVSFMWGVSQTFLPIYAETVGVGVVLIGILFGVQSATNAIGRIPLGAVFDRLKRKWVIMVVGVVFESLGTALIIHFSDPVMFGIFMVLIGFGMGVTQMAASALISEASNPTTRGLGMGFFYTCFYGDMAVSPTTIGLVISALGFAPGFLAAAVVGLAAILIVLALTTRTSSRAAP